MPFYGQLLLKAGNKFPMDVLMPGCGRPGPNVGQDSLGLSAVLTARSSGTEGAQRLVPAILLTCQSSQQRNIRWGFQLLL